MFGGYEKWWYFDVLIKLIVSLYVEVIVIYILGYLVIVDFFW